MTTTALLLEFLAAEDAADAWSRRHPHPNALTAAERDEWPPICWRAIEAKRAVLAYARTLSVVTHTHTTAQLMRNTPDEKAREISAELRGELAAAEGGGK